MISETSLVCVYFCDALISKKILRCPREENLKKFVTPLQYIQKYKKKRLA
jgi:hypothetical protein